MQELTALDAATRQQFAAALFELFDAFRQVLRSHDLEEETRLVIEPGVSALLRGAELLDAAHAEMAAGMREDFERGNEEPVLGLGGLGGVGGGRGGACEDGADAEQAGNMPSSGGNPFGSAPSAGREISRPGSNSNMGRRMMRGMPKAPSFFRKAGMS